MALTYQEREALRHNCEVLNEDGLLRYAEKCALANRLDAAKFVHEVIAQRTIRKRAEATPLEVSGTNRVPMQDKRRTVADNQAVAVSVAPHYWTAERTKYAALAVGVSAVGVSVVAYVVIPVLAFVASVVMSVVSASAPWLVGGGAVLLFLRSVISGEKKTDSVQAQSPRSGDVYNVYIGSGQQVTVKQGE